MDASRIKIGLATSEEELVINEKSYTLWNGYLTYDDRPLIALSGLESTHEEYGTSILVSDAGDRENRIATIKIKDTVTREKEDGTTSTFTPVSSTNVNFLGLNFPGNGFINEDPRRFVLKYDSKSAAYLMDPELGGKNYLKHDRPIPQFIDSVSDITAENMTLMLDSLAEFFPEFQDWWKTTFPTSGANKRMAASEMLKKLVNSGFKKEELKVVENSIPFD